MSERVRKWHSITQAQDIIIGSKNTKTMVETWKIAHLPVAVRVRVLWFNSKASRKNNNGSTANISVYCSHKSCVRVCERQFVCKNEKKNERKKPSRSICFRTNPRSANTVSYPQDFRSTIEGFWYFFGTSIFPLVFCWFVFYMSSLAKHCADVFFFFNSQARGGPQNKNSTRSANLTPANKQKNDPYFLFTNNNTHSFLNWRVHQKESKKKLLHPNFATHDFWLHPNFFFFTYCPFEYLPATQVPSFYHSDDSNICRLPHWACFCLVCFFISKYLTYLVSKYFLIYRST